MDAIILLSFLHVSETHDRDFPCGREPRRVRAQVAARPLLQPPQQLVGGRSVDPAEEHRHAQRIEHVLVHAWVENTVAAVNANYEARGLRKSALRRTHPLAGNAHMPRG